MQILRSCFDSLLVADTLPSWSVGPLVRNVTFLYSERFFALQSRIAVFDVMDGHMDGPTESMESTESTEWTSYRDAFLIEASNSTLMGLH